MSRFVRREKKKPVKLVSSFLRSEEKDDDQKKKELAPINQKLEENPKSDQLYFMRAFIHFKWGDILKGRGSAYMSIKEIGSVLENFCSCLELTPDNIEALIFRSKIYKDISQYEESLEDLTKAISLDHKNEEAYFSRANLYIEMEEYEKAISDFDTCLNDLKDRNGDDSVIYNNRGFCNKELGIHKEAIKDYSRSLEIDPNSEVALSNRGASFVHIGLYDEAVEDFSNYVLLHQKGLIQSSQEELYEIINNMGYCRLQQKKYRLSIDDFSAAISISPVEISSYENRALSYLGIGDFESSLRDFNHCLKRFPNQTRILLNRASLYEKMSKFNLASEDYTTVIELRKENKEEEEEGEEEEEDDNDDADDEVFFLRAECYRKLGEFEKAMLDMNKYLKKHGDNDDGDALYTRGLVYNKLNKFELAVDDFNIVFEMNNQDSCLQELNEELLFNRGNSYQGMKKYQEAVDDYTKSIGMNSKREGSFYNRGNAYVKLGKYSEAIEDYTKCILLDNDMARAYFNRGKCHKIATKDDYGKSLMDFSKCVFLDPKHCGAYYNRAMVLKAMRQFEKAVSDMKMCVEILEEDKGRKYNRKYENAYLHLATYYQKKGMLNECMRWIEKGLEMNPDNTKLKEKKEKMGEENTL